MQETYNLVMGLFSKILKSLEPAQEPKIAVTVTAINTSSSRKKKVFSDNDPGLLDALESNVRYEPTQKLPLSSACPYCGVILPKPIGRKKKCPECKNDIYVRTTQDLFSSSALTSEQVTHVDFYMVLKNILMATKNDYIAHEKQLKQSWNTKKVNTYDVLWSMYNDIKLLERNIDKTAEREWQLTEMFRNKQGADIGAASYQAARGHNPVPYLEGAQEYSIKMARLHENAKGLTVHAYDCCDACTKFHNKTFSLDFIEKNKVLPIKTCTRPYADNSKFVFCTCSYSEYYEWDT